SATMKTAAVKTATQSAARGSVGRRERHCSNRKGQSNQELSEHLWNSPTRSSLCRDDPAAFVPGIISKCGSNFRGRSGLLPVQGEPLPIKLRQRSPASVAVRHDHCGFRASFGGRNNYIRGVVNQLKGGGPVSHSKRCHLAEVAR